MRKKSTCDASDLLPGFSTSLVGADGSFHRNLSAAKPSLDAQWTYGFLNRDRMFESCRARQHLLGF